MQLVSVICLCHNHKAFVKEALQSVLQQTYTNIQLIIVDDASTDGSQKVITEFVSQHPGIQYISLSENVGSCKALNIALASANGDFIIDLAADDVLLPERIKKGLDTLEKCGEDYGLQFSDAIIINAEGRQLGLHSDKFPHESIPHGDIYKDLIERYFICSPTMMFRKALIQELNGYDEELSYEDFDLWIRSSRKWKYCYSSEALIKRRVVPGSLSHKQFSLRSNHQYSTYLICKKIMCLNRADEEKQALNRRIKYEIRMNIRLLNWQLVWLYFKLFQENNKMQYD
ncbi:glycosyltransferase family 2 protein [Chryseotalea sanaruensis]|uniref:Glycosyltransferase family 2 protein n=1 Tax=Chryseotalea sanaruensis TaxID=2482724 RepID=A0A401U5J7_9BACT|nr:glycosyltransferase family 2 protein [Chryseotalea sanaruensis]GCC50155.1 glycosyltransferase family 2 protein [Chryseotalea sanaruensis]